MGLREGVEPSLKNIIPLSQMGNGQGDRVVGDEFDREVMNHRAGLNG